MLNFKKLIDTKFSLVESVKIYAEIAFEMFVPIMKTAAVSVVFIFFVQALLSLLEFNYYLNICFLVISAGILFVAVASCFRMAEDIILGKNARIYVHISHILKIFLKLFIVTGIIASAVVLLLLPLFFVKTPLFLLPYSVIAGIFIIGVMPYVYFAPLAVVLREANIKNSFIFSYYMALERWGEIFKAISAQFLFVLIVAFWAYFVVSLMFFPNTSEFFSFLFSKAIALSEQARNLYVRYILWETMQVFVFVLVTGIFVGTNTVLFYYLEGSLEKLIKKKEKIKISPSKMINRNVKFVDILQSSDPVNIDTEKEEEISRHKKRDEALRDIYGDAVNSNFIPQDETKKRASKKRAVVSEDNYPEQ